MALKTCRGVLGLDKRPDLLVIMTLSMINIVIKFALISGYWVVRVGVLWVGII